MAELSATTLEEVFSQYMATTLVTLIKYVAVDNTGTEVVNRYVDNWESITSNGEDFISAAFKIAIGSDEADSMPQVSLVFDAGDREIISQLREYNEAPKVYISVIVAERPDTIEIPEVEFEVVDWTVKNTEVTMTLETEPVLNEPIVGDKVTPEIFPLLWENVVLSSS